MNIVFLHLLLLNSSMEVMRALWKIGHHKASDSDMFSKTFNARIRMRHEVHIRRKLLRQVSYVEMSP